MRDLGKKYDTDKLYTMMFDPSGHVRRENLLCTAIIDVSHQGQRKTENTNIPL